LDVGFEECKEGRGGGELGQRVQGGQGGESHPRRHHRQGRVLPLPVVDALAVPHAGEGDAGVERDPHTGGDTG